jgi:hypothetical protein
MPEIIEALDTAQMDHARHCLRKSCLARCHFCEKFDALDARVEEPKP